MTYLALIIGSLLGGILRYVLSMTIPTPDSFPLGILIINLSGSLILGVFYGVSDTRRIKPWLRVGFGTGVIGTFTTFSTFCMGTDQLASSALYLSGAYVAISIIGGPLLAYLGNQVVLYSRRILSTWGELS